jgi:hypothetical protein
MLSVVLTDDVGGWWNGDGLGRGFGASARFSIACFLVCRTDGESTTGRAEELDPRPASHRQPVWLPQPLPNSYGSHAPPGGLPPATSPCSYCWLLCPHQWKTRASHEPRYCTKPVTKEVETVMERRSGRKAIEKWEKPFFGHGSIFVILLSLIFHNP